MERATDTGSTAFQRVQYFFGGDRQRLDAHTHRVLHGVGDGRRSGNQRGLADAHAVIVSAAEVGLNDPRFELRDVLDVGDFVFAAARRQHFTALVVSEIFD